MTRQTRDPATLIARLHARARRLRSCPEEAADLAQDAALRLWQRQVTGQRIDNPEAYAMTALANLARSRWRANRPSEEFREDMAMTAPEAPARLAVAELRRAMARLPPEQAALMALVAAGETSPAELARLTGVPPGTVMSRLARARAALRRRLGLAKSAPGASLLD
ncbi:RNA polymerase sigma factor [Sedimentitalea arenosa]|jgi:RNA polymerase sigma-70 factor (ECF subfamily)|uniref:Sigma-70 family RNA polymerase sigma factor n=1 Tax=Sedimentitalea arenosa TaxID=2798803 RepID=A0A8J7J0T9_9RHOB|nr:sigma-70 family RNA polymerase sigma factor [Arenibacterium arenosum]MBJ6370310.1 sigma-70 family RNA polymerase sigma factor [Arenibacterium arenosum]